MITKLIEELTDLADYFEKHGFIGRYNLIKCAISTIEELSTKLHASQMERSSQYYHGGWIPCEEYLPEENGVYLISYEDAVALMEFFNGKWFLYQRQPAEEAGTILAWRPLPEPYRKE